MVSSITSGINALFASFSEIEALRAARAGQSGHTSKNTDSLAVTQDAPSRRNNGSFAALREREPSLANLGRPKATLSPVDELALFSENAADAPVEEYPVGLRESNAVETPSSAQYNLQLRKPSYIAQLYAQTNDITFSSDTLYRQAA
jgi:hypothetical protein